MNLLKKSVSVALSILMVSNFTFCRALEKTEKLPDNKEESSLTSYILAGAAGAVSVAALAFGAAYFFSRNNDSSNGYVNNLAYNYGNPGKNVSVNAKSGPVNIQNVPANIKAIHWNKNRCWWISSIMFLYYWTDFKNYIHENSENNFQNIIIGDTKNTENYRLFFKDLNEIFEVLDNCKGNVCYITNDEVKMGKYFNHLKNCGFEVINNRFNESMLATLLTTFNSAPLMERFGTNAAENAHYRDNVGNEYNIRHMASNNNGGHYYIYLEPVSGGKGFIIGQEYRDDFKSIKFDNLNWRPHAYEPLRKVAIYT